MSGATIAHECSACSAGSPKWSTSSSRPARRSEPVGKRGPLAKPADRVQGHRRRELTLVHGDEAPVVKVPRPPKGLAPEVRRAWSAYWRSPMARLAQDVDRP